MLIIGLDPFFQYCQPAQIHKNLPPRDFSSTHAYEDPAWIGICHLLLKNQKKRSTITTFVVDFIFYRVSHSKEWKVILLWWAHRFWFLLIFWVLHVHQLGPFMPNQFSFFWCCAPPMVQLLNTSCCLMKFELFWLLGAFFQVIKSNTPSKM